MGRPSIHRRSWVGDPCWRQARVGWDVGVRLYTRVMTADRRELHELVDALPDDQVARALADVRRRVPATSGERPWPPAFFGMGVDKDGRTDLSVSVDEILAGGFGATRS